MRTFLIGPNDAGQRLDRFIGKSMPDLPFSLVQKGIREKNIKLDGKRAKAGEILAVGQSVSVFLRDSKTATGTTHPWRGVSPDSLEIVYEDANILLANKEPGLSAHPDRHSASDTLITRVQAYLYAGGQWDPAKENSFTPALAHRLDRNTGGLILAAKTAEALRVLNEKFRSREIEKHYLCLVHGRPNPLSGTLRHFLLRNMETCRVEVRPDRQDGAKTALMAYRVLATRDCVSLVECRPLTGRTHQIRAQWAAAGHPLLGDGKYGAGSRDKALGYHHQALFAFRLTFAFKSPSGCLGYLGGRTFELENAPFAEGFTGARSRGSGDD